MARLIAPHFAIIEGAADGRDRVRRSCAFTTAAPGWRRDRTGATHLHTCMLLTEAATPTSAECTAWRTTTLALGRGLEEQLLGMSRGVAVPSTETMAVTGGESADLPTAITAAIAMACAPRPAEADPTAAALPGTALVAPAFVAMVREPNLPRIWTCSFLSALGDAGDEGPVWTHLQSCLIRERPGRVMDRFLCEVESLPSALALQHLRPDAEPSADHDSEPGYRLRRWSVETLHEAIGECLAFALAESDACTRSGLS